MRARRWAKSLLVVLAPIPAVCGAQEAAGVLAAGTFRSPTPVVVLDGAPAMPYPSTIEVSGLAGLLTGITVGFADFEHVSPRDTDALLVAPSGAAVLVLSDACGLTDLIDVDLAFDDAAPGPLPDVGPCLAGAYQASDYAPADAFPAPAPAGPWGTALAGFLGESPNGTWSLYAVDDLAVGDAGRIEWWYLTLTTDPGYLFTDGFELGSSARWSAAVP